MKAACEKLMLFGTTQSPKGPNLRKSVPVRCNLSGTKLTFLKPLSNASKISGEEPSADLPLAFNENIYSLDSFNEIRNNAWGILLAEERYKYHGPPFINPDVGGMEFTASLRKIGNDLNLLKASDYEHWVDSDIKAYYSPGTGSVFQEWLYLFPLFWQTFKLPNTNGVQWVAYAVQDLSCQEGDLIKYYVRAAISSEHELVFSFRATTDDYDSGAFGLFKEISNFILNSVEIVLTDSIAEEIKALSKSGLRNFSEKMPVLRFDDAPKNKFSNYELLNDPCFYFTKINKVVDRRLWSK
ncbi:hypothetical protein ACG1BZ_10540 [Microbulbifer sp. CNSA002]|uniref:hypothetical protein n=1 Tax=unclassified Microbulbifer TaxID=2619833 RepID=UPI0039B46723